MEILLQRVDSRDRSSREMFLWPQILKHVDTILATYRFTVTTCYVAMTGHVGDLAVSGSYRNIFPGLALNLTDKVARLRSLFLKGI